MNATRTSEIRTYRDIQAQANLERLLHAKRRKQAAARQLSYRPVKPIPEPQDSDAPLPAMLAWCFVGLTLWAIFGWVVVAVVRSWP